MERYRRLVEHLRPWDGVVVAFSGGVDSTLLAAAAREALGDRALAATGDSDSLAAHEREQAAATAAAIGIRHRFVETREIERPGYVANAPDRCYYCKSELYDRLREVAREEGAAFVAVGAILEDAGDHRPGMRAAAERGVRAPLLDLGFGKEEVRRTARALDLPTWDKPAQPCLASRIPYGTAVTAERLGRVERAEAYLRDRGFRELRVRDHDAVARIEVPAGEIPRLVAPAMREGICEAFRSFGFRYVAIDLEGFASGRLNRELPAHA